jgi:B-cell receptor-associated protein 31
MSFQWTFLASFLYCELLVVILLLLPFISPRLYVFIFIFKIRKKNDDFFFHFIVGRNFLNQDFQKHLQLEQNIILIL